MTKNISLSHIVFHLNITHSSHRQQVGIPGTSPFLLHTEHVTRSVILTEKHRLRVFENRVLRKTFGPERDEVMGEMIILHNEELNGLCSSPNIIWVIKWRRMRWAEHEASMGVRRDAYRVLVGKHEG